MSQREPSRLELLRRLIDREMGPSYPHNARSALLITNFSAWWEAARRKRKTWVLYRVDTLTPGWYYIGITMQPIERAYQHLQGHTPFTRKYGMKSMTILAMLSTRNEAEQTEWRFWFAKSKIDGAKVGYVAESAE